MTEISSLDERRVTVWSPNGEYWHRFADDDYGWTRCGLEVYEAVPTGRLSEVPSEDRCRTCWPTPKDVTP